MSATQRPKVIVTNWVHRQVLEQLREHCEVVANHDRDRPMRREEILGHPDAEGLMAFMPDMVDQALLEGLPELRVVACALKGYDNFDLAACERRGAWVTIVPDLLTVPTAELTVGLIISLARNVMAGDRHLRSGEFAGWRPKLYGRGLAERTVGFLGMGAVGRAIAQRLAGFEPYEMLYHDRKRLSEVEEGRLKLRQAGFERIVEASDYLVLALPLTRETTGLVDAAVLKRMKPGAYLINTARGSLVDEEAIADALAEGRLAGYAADVFPMEDWIRADRPRSVSARLLGDPDRTLLTPHLGSAVEEVRIEIALSAARSLLQALAGERPEGAINDPAPARRAGAGA